MSDESDDACDPSWDDVARMALALRALFAHVHHLRQANGEPRPGSLAALEQQDHRLRPALRDAYSQAKKLLDAAADHLWALSEMSTPHEGKNMLRFAPWVVTRALLEACTLGLWLLNPTVLSKERVGRSFAIRYRGLYEQRKLEDALPESLRQEGDRAHNVGMDAKEFESRLDEVAREAEELDFPPIRRKGKRDGAGMRVPGITDLVGETLGTGAFYKYLCAIAHAQPWALTEVGFRVADTPYSTDDLGQPVEFLLEGCAEPSSFTYLCRTAAMAFAKCVVAAATLFGWDLGDLRLEIESDLQDLGISWSEIL